MKSAKALFFWQNKHIIFTTQIKIKVMKKLEALKNCLDCIEKYEYISEDGVLDECDEDMSLVEKGELTNEQWAG